MSEQQSTLVVNHHLDCRHGRPSHSVEFSDAPSRRVTRTLAWHCRCTTMTLAINPLNGVRYREFSGARTEPGACRSGAFRRPTHHALIPMGGWCASPLAVAQDH